MSTDTPKYKWLNEQEFHELCMDYRGASPLLANDCYIRLQEFIVSQLERELAAETEKVKRLREALEKLVERNYQYNGVEARARFGSHDEAVSTVNHARATLEATK